MMALARALVLIFSLAAARAPGSRSSRLSCPPSRRSTTAPIAAAFRSAWGLSDLKSDRVRLPAPSIARARQQFARDIARVLANMTSRTYRAGCWSSAEENLSPSERSLQVTTPATVHAPAAKASYAPPALTFGRPGKQKVKFVNDVSVLPRPVRHLCRNIRHFTGLGSKTGRFASSAVNQS